VSLFPIAMKSDEALDTSESLCCGNVVPLKRSVGR
jgi:hypothetical protein